VWRDPADAPPGAPVTTPALTCARFAHKVRQRPFAIRTSIFNGTGAGAQAINTETNIERESPLKAGSANPSWFWNQQCSALIIDFFHRPPRVGFPRPPGRHRFTPSQERRPGWRSPAGSPACWLTGAQSLGGPTGGSLEIHWATAAGVVVGSGVFPTIDQRRRAFLWVGGGSGPKPVLCACVCISPEGGDISPFTPVIDYFKVWIIRDVNISCPIRSLLHHDRFEPSF